MHTANVMDKVMDLIALIIRHLVTISVRVRLEPVALTAVYAALHTISIHGKKEAEDHWLLTRMLHVNVCELLRAYTLLLNNTRLIQ